MSSKIAMTIRLGSNTQTFQSVAKATQAFVDELAANSAKTQRDKFEVDVRKMEKKVTTAARNELLSGLAFARNSMMGVSGGSSSSDTVFNFRDENEPTFGLRGAKTFGPAIQGMTPVRWRYLSFATRAKKVPANKNKFFVNTGTLKKKLLDTARDMVNKTGVVRFVYRSNGRFTKVTAKTPNIPIGNVTLRFLPNITSAQLPGLANGDPGSFNKTMEFERKLGLSGLDLAKLRGPGREGGDPYVHRPLLQPVFTYWAIYKLPRRIASVMDDLLYDPRGPKNR